MPLGRNRDQDLYKAAKSGNVVAIDRLLGSRKKGKGSVKKGPKGLNPNVQDTSGMTPLHYAALNGHNDVVQLLLLSGASAHLADQSGSFPIHLAAWKGDLEVTKTLVERGPSQSNVNALSDCLETPLHLASQYGNTDVVEYLLEKRADPKLVNNKGETALDLAALFGHVDVVRSITRYHPDLLQQNFVQTSPLHLAARNGHVNVISVLITAGMDINTVCDQGSVLHEAALFGKTEVVEQLMQKGVDVSLVNKEGKTALDVLKQFPSKRTDRIRDIIMTSSCHRDSWEPVEQGEVPNCHSGGDVMPSSLNPLYDNVVVAHTDHTAGSTVYYAVARVDYEDVSNPCVLVLRTGKRIDVIGANSNGTWLGVSDGQEGNFFASHVDFYQNTQDGVKKISLEEIDPTLLQSRFSSVVENSSTADSQGDRLRYKVQIPLESSSHISDVAAVRRDTTYAQLNPVLRDDTTKGTDLPQKSDYYLNVSTATTAAVAGQPPSKVSLQDAIREGRVGVNLSLNDKMERNDYLNLSKGAHSYLNFEEAHQRSLEYITPPKLIDTEETRKALHRLPHERQLSKGEIAFMADSWSEGRFDRIFDDNSVGGLNRPRIVSLGDLETDLRKEAQEKVLEEVEEESIPIREITTPEMGNVLRGRDPFLGGGGRGPKKYRSSLLSGKPRESPLPSLPPPTPPRVSKVPPVEEDESYSNVTFDPHPPRCYEWSKPKNLTETHDTLAEDSAPLYSSSAPTPPTYQVYDNVVLKTKPRKRVEAPPPLSEASAHPIDLQRMELAKMNYENINIIFQNHQKETHSSVPTDSSQEPDPGSLDPGSLDPGSLDPGSLNPGSLNPGSLDPGSLDPGSLNPGSLDPGSLDPGSLDPGGHQSPPKPAPRSRTSSFTQSNYENVSLKSRSKAKTESVVISDRENAYAGLILASKSFSSSGEGARLYSMWTDKKDKEAWHQVDSLIQGIDCNVQHIWTAIQDPSKAVDLLEWLSSLGLAGYAAVFESHGFDSLKFLGEGILDKTDLDEMRIVDPEAQRTILRAVMGLAPPPETAHLSGLQEWFKAIELDYLYPEMVANGYSTLQKLTQIELWNIQLGNKDFHIALLGHRKRFLHSFSQLKALHPEWRELPDQEPETTAEMTNGLSKSLEDISLHKDYTTISSKQKENEDNLSPDTSWDRTHSSSLSPKAISRKISNVSIRPPTVAQSDAWRLAREAELLEMGELLSKGEVCIGYQDEWRHTVDTLLNSCVDFNVMYLGSLLLKSKKITAAEAVVRLKIANAFMVKKPEVLLSVSWQQVRYYDAQSRQLVSEHSIHHISSSSQDSSDPDIFSYITNESGLIFCHVFKAPDKDVSDDIVMTLGQAFEVAYQKLQRARAKSSGASIQGKIKSGPHPLKSGLTDEELQMLDLGPDK